VQFDSTGSICSRIWRKLWNSNSTFKFIQRIIMDDQLRQLPFSWKSIFQVLLPMSLSHCRTRNYKGVIPDRENCKHEIHNTYFIMQILNLGVINTIKIWQINQQFNEQCHLLAYCHARKDPQRPLFSHGFERRMKCHALSQDPH